MIHLALLSPARSTRSTSKVRPGRTAALTSIALCASLLTGCAGTSDAGAVSTPIVAESTAPGSLGPVPSASVSVAPKGPTSAECMALAGVLDNATTIGLKSDQGLVEQGDVDRAFGADVVGGVPSDAMPYVDAAKAVAQNLVGKDPVAATDFLGQWQKVYAQLTAAKLTACS